MNGRAPAIYVRNIGKTTVSVENVFISLSDGTGGLHVYSLPTFDASPSSVIQGDLITVKFTDSDLGFSPLANVTYTVQVFTARGVGDTYQVVT